MRQSPAPRVAAIYARRSVSRVNSVSIEQQIEAAKDLISRRGLRLYGEVFEDDGVSAISRAARERPAFKRLEAHLDEIDVLVVYKVDRLARSTKDFFDTTELLRSLGTELISVTDNIDMTTAGGRAFAAVLATFAELEADYIRERYSAARNHAVRHGRLVGGTVPYGWQRHPHPSGKGYVLVRHPEQSPILREMAERAMRGESLYSIKRWLEVSEVQPPAKVQAQQQTTPRWTYATIERLLRNPRLAGLTPYQPGRKRHEPSDPDAVLRDDEGRPIISSEVAIVTLDERRSLLARLDNKTAPQARPRSSKRRTSPFLAQAVHCGHCDRMMARKTLAERPALGCPTCHQSISRPQLEEYLISRLLTERGHMRSHTLLEKHVSNGEEIARVQSAISHYAVRLQEPGADVPALMSKMRAAVDTQNELRLTEGKRVHEWVRDTRTLNEAWADTQSDEERRDLLLSHMARIEVWRGRAGRYLDKDRVHITWNIAPPDDPGVPGTQMTAWSPGQGDRGRIDAIILSTPDGPGRRRSRMVADIPTSLTSGDAEPAGEDLNPGASGR